MPRIWCSSTLITPPWPNTATVSSWSAAGHQIVDGGADSGPERGLVDAAGQLAVDQPLQLLRVLGGDLLDRHVVRQVPVVLGEALVDFDCQPERVGDRRAVCTARRCGLLTNRGDRKPGQRLGQSRGLLQTGLADRRGIGALHRVRCAAAAHVGPEAIAP